MAKKKVEEAEIMEITEVESVVPESIDYYALMNTEGVAVDKAPAGSKSDTMLKTLAVQPKTRFIVPLEGNEKRGTAIANVIMNGLRINIKKGVFVDIPRQVAEHLEECYYQTNKAVNESEFRTATGDPVKNMGKV